MKKRTTIIIVLVVIATIAALLIIIKKRKFKKYELTESAHDFLQIYKIQTNEAGQQYAEPYMYNTNADYVKANIDKSVELIYQEGIVDMQETFIPVSKVIYNDGKKISYNANKNYILLNTIKNI